MEKYVCSKCGKIGTKEDTSWYRYKNDGDVVCEDCFNLSTIQKQNISSNEMLKYIKRTSDDVRTIKNIILILLLLSILGALVWIGFMGSIV